MCEWYEGRREEKAVETLLPFGGTQAQRESEISEGNVVQMQKADLDELFKQVKTFNGALREWDWNIIDKQFRGVLTACQVFNLLMIYGAPHNCLTDTLWSSLVDKYPVKS